MNKTAVYVRVSTVSQDFQAQQHELQRWLDGHGIPNARWFSDQQTGSNLDRPGFKDLQKAIFNGEVDTVVVYKLDRLSRSLRDGLNTLCDWIERNVRVVSVTQQLDFSGTMGKMIASVFFAVAEMERENIRERQAAGIAAAKKRGGVFKGRAKGSTKAKPKRAQELRQQGLKVAEIANAMNVSERTVIRYLQS